MRIYPFILLLFLTIGSSIAQTSVSLRESMVRSKANNPFLRTQRLETDVVKSDITTANLRLNPDFQTQIYFIPNPGYYAENTGILSPQNTQTWYQIGMPIRLQPIRKLANDLAVKNLSYTQTNISEIERNLSFEVSKVWLDIWSLKKNTEILLQAKLNIDTLVQINKNRLKNEVITISELIRTEVLSEQYDLQIRDISQEYKNQIRVLSVLTGAKDSISIVVSDEFVFEKALPPLDSLVQISKNKRADLQAATLSTTVAKSNVELQNALAYPNLYGAAFVNPQNTVPYMGLIAGIQIPVFDRNQGGIERSKAVVKQTESNVAALQWSIETEIKNAYQSYLTKKGNLQRFQNIMHQSEIVLNTVRYKYLKGNTTIIDFLEAQRTALETKKIYFSEVLAYRMSYLQVLYASGLINDI